MTKEGEAEDTSNDIKNFVYAIREKDKEKSNYEIQAELKGQGIITRHNTIQKIMNKYPELCSAQKESKKSPSYDSSSQVSRRTTGRSL